MVVQSSTFFCGGIQRQKSVFLLTKKNNLSRLTQAFPETLGCPVLNQNQGLIYNKVGRIWFLDQQITIFATVYITFSLVLTSACDFIPTLQLEKLTLEDNKCLDLSHTAD